jgi:peptide/nickel transport system permease protein
MTPAVASPDDPPRARHARGYRSRVVAQLRGDPVALLCLFFLVVLTLCAIFAPWVAPADPNQSQIVARLRSVGSPGFLLGSDELGRDMLSRLLYGARLSLLMGTVPVLVAFFVGLVLGTAAGFAGGLLNGVIMRTVDIFYAFPSVLLAVAISGFLGSGSVNIMIAMTVVFIPPITRIAESVTNQVRAREFVAAARSSGASAALIVRVHVLPNVVSPVFVYATSLVSVSIVIASGLSLLGLGPKPPQAEWGLMLNSLRSALEVNPVVAALPGLFIFLTSLSFNLVSDALREAIRVKA